MLLLPVFLRVKRWGRHGFESWLLAATVSVTSHQRGEARGACSCLQVKPTCLGWKPGLDVVTHPEAGENLGF